MKHVQIEKWKQGKYRKLKEAIALTRQCKIVIWGNTKPRTHRNNLENGIINVSAIFMYGTLKIAHALCYSYEFK